MFAYLREKHGDQVVVAADPSVRAVTEALSSAGVATESCRMAVNLEFAHPDRTLSPDDELALIPPVSGG